MMNLEDHTANGRCILFLYLLTDLMKTEGLQCTLLVNRITDTASNLLDLYCCHDIISSFNR